ncbi:MAG TPA: penicillin acylase family protein [Streptosporangiaceae bacterium]|nr:penicillin acylase family protein [Streptosporangiaceae bacterium]
MPVRLCRAHRPRYLRLWRLPSVRVAGTAIAVVAVAVAALTATPAPPVAWAAVLAVGVLAVGGYLFRCRARVAMEARMVRALLQARVGCPGAVEVPELSEQVRAEVLSNGVTRIQAGCWPDAVRALGYAMARDRGFQMDMLRRMASGRLAEVWGKTALPSDLAYRPLGLAAAATRAAAALDTPEASLLSAFSAGVNAAFEQHGHAFECRFLSYRPRPWTAEDSLQVALFLFHSLSWNETAKRAEAVTRQVLPAAIADFFLPAPPGEAPPLPERLAALRADGDAAAGVVAVDRATVGSNCWVLGGPGAPVLACDLHMALTMPGLLYEVDLAWPGGRLRGLAAAGLPVVLSGSNGHLVWGVTNLNADVLDLVDVGEGMPPEGLITRTERIRVRGRPDASLKVTSRGTMPVLPSPLPPGRAAVRWTGHDERCCDLKFQRLAHAASVAEGVSVLEDAQGMALNVLLADQAGHMAHLATGLIPRRPAGTADGEHSHLDGKERPRLIDPPDGMLVSANDAALPEQPFRIGYDPDPGHRARRVRELAAGSPKTISAMRKLQRDEAAGLYLPYRELAVSALAGRDDDLAGLLARWDGTAGTQSRAFSVLVRLRQLLASQVLSPYLAACREHDARYQYPYRCVDRPLLAILGRKDPSLLQRGGQAAGWEAFIADCAKRAVAELEQATGRPGPPAWGRLNRVSLNHPMEQLAPWAAPLLGIAARSQPGALHSVRACAPGFGAAGRVVLSPGPDGFAAFELPGGQSGHPLSSHFANRHEEWSSVAPPAARPPQVRCGYFLRPARVT